MKVALCSDLHLEFQDINLKNEEGANVLILSGDILVAEDLHQHPEMSYGMYSNVNLADLGRRQESALRFREFLKRCSFQFPHVIYIMGNHEHYHGDFSKSLGNLRTHLGYLRNLYILDKEVKVIDDVMFIAGTLWTDMNKEDPLTLNGIRGYMNDYRIIANGNNVSHYRDQDGNSHERVAALMPEDTVVEHKEMLKVIERFVKQNPNTKTVVCGHHAPSKLSTKPRYEKDVMVNGAYSSDLSEFILDHPSIKLWTHGHTHHEFDYMIGSTRIVCNPRGYDGYEDQAENFTLKTVEI